jgi:hypothetical protein
MKYGRTRNQAMVPMMMAELAFTAWSTIARRTLLIAQGRCSAAEYQRMVAEKSAAAQESLIALSRMRSPGGLAPVLQPWLKRTKANARRLGR